MQGYNAQLAVDGAHQVIVAESVASAQNDAPELPQILKQIKANTGRQAHELSADNGYLSEQNIVCLQRHHIRGYIPLGRQKHGTSETSRSSRKPTGPYTIAMGQRLKRAGFRSRYRLRKQIVEPVNGHIKEARGFRRFSMRGLSKVRGEWTLICIAHNLLKLARFQSPS